MRAKINFDLEHSASIRINGVGGRTVAKLCKHYFPVIETVNPDILISEVGTNDLSILPPEVVGSQLKELVKYIRNNVSIRVVCVCEVIDRYLPNTEQLDVHFPNKAAILRQYLSVVLADIPQVFIWKHKDFSPLKQAMILKDCSLVCIWPICFIS